MPDGVAQSPEQPSKRKELQCKFYSVYMRAWTKIPEFACNHVPQLWKQDTRSFWRTWTWHIRGHIVSKHQARIIHQFMLMNCGRSTSDVGLDLEAAGESGGNKPPEFDNGYCMKNTIP